MDFFMSAEREADVRDGESYARKKISPILTELLNPVVLDSGLKSWSFISIILSDTFLPGMPEIIKLNKKTWRLIAECILITTDSKRQESMKKSR